MKIAKHYRPELVASTDKERPNLLDPYLDAKRERLVATDGHGLVALPVDTEKTERSRYLARSLLQAARALGDPELPAEIDDQEIVEFGVLWPTEQGRIFPDWQAVMPKFRRRSPGTVTFALNPGLLNKIARAMGVGGVCLTIELGATEEKPSPIIVQPLEDDADEVGLLMPMRADGAGDPLLAPGQICPVCRKILAAGAHCPEHGDPMKQDGAAEKATGPQRAAPTALVWKDEEEGLRVARVAGGSYGLTSCDEGGFTAAWKPHTGRGKMLVIAKPEAEALAAVQAHYIEHAGDAFLANAGDGELNRKDLKGPAAARKKKGGRR